MRETEKRKLKQSTKNKYDVICSSLTHLRNEPNIYFWFLPWKKCHMNIRGFVCSLIFVHIIIFYDKPFKLNENVECIWYKVKMPPSYCFTLIRIRTISHFCVLPFSNLFILYVVLESNFVVSNYKNITYVIIIMI